MTIPILGEKPVAKRYDWAPAPDITAYELARCLPSILAGVVQHPAAFAMIENLEPENRRHFRSDIDDAKDIDIGNPENVVDAPTGA